MAARAARIALFGGTFDPIHLGHLIAAEEAYQQLGVDTVIFVPTGQPWLKQERAITPAHHRLAMLQLATARYAEFEVSDLEVRRPGPTYTVDTLEEVHRLWGPELHCFFILGWDALRDLPRWKEPHRLLQLCTLAVLPRPDGAPAWTELEAALPGLSQRVHHLSMPMVGISSSDIRRRVAEGRSIRFLVPEAVEGYIREHRLYRS